MDKEFQQKKYNRLLGLVIKLRYYQNLFYQHKASAYREKAIYYGRQIDRFIRKEKEYIDSQQGELF